MVNFQELFPAVRFIFFWQKNQKKDAAPIRARALGFIRK
jgi:hypothetical protein